jgi:drug/metabolite transporter (DMT)-like permease
VLVTAAVLASALLHATWNALAHRSADSLGAVSLITIGLAVVSLPLAFVVTPPLAASWPFLALALVLHVGYTLLLGRCYTIGEFSQVYPLARGSAPLVVAALAVLLVGERLSFVALGGVAAICGGLAVLVIGARLRGGLHNPRAVALAGVTGLSIAGYTTVDGIGVRHAGETALGYTVWLLGLLGVSMLVYSALLYGRRLGAALRPIWWMGLVGATFGWASYALVLWAQTRGALAAVAALRETSVVWAAVLGAVFFGERFGRRRVAATVLVAVGVVLLNV